jgi:predicted amidohydrolase
VKVAAIQHDIVWEDRDATLERLAPQVAAAAGTGARLVVLTEMFATGFSMRTDRTAELLDGPTVTWMHQRAVQHDVWLAGSVPLSPEEAPGADASEDRPTNSLLVVGPDGTRHRYDKRHPFSYAGEHERFRAGDDLVTVEVEGVRWSLSVCYDLRFADLYWQQAADTDAYLVVANWPSARRHHWRALLDARAIENQAYVVGVNRVGSGGKLDYAGDSRIVDPLGEVLASAASGESLLVTDIDPEVVADTRERFPFAADRRG